MEPFDEPVPAARMEALRERLVRAALAQDLVDVAYRVVASPLGELLIAGTARGVVRVAFAVENADTVLQELADTVSPRLLAAPRRLDEAARELDEYFDGRRRRFELDLDLRLARGFRLEVLHRLREIGYGSTASYAEVAAGAGHPRAVRAVGTACALNPVPLLIPCHRVVRSDGARGAYRGGAEAKAYLLDLERRVRGGPG